MSLTKILQDAQDLDDSIRYAAEGDLTELQKLDLPNFLLSLSAELASDESPPECRRLAGIILKNSVEGKHSEDNDLNIKQWIKLDPLIKSQIKESLLTTLGSLVPDAWQASSQVTAKLAYIEIPGRDWQELIGKLLGNMAQEGASSPLKQATLETLGHVFDEIPGLDTDGVNDVLNAVTEAMNQAELSYEVRLAAVKALQNVLKHANFANDDCQNLIMSAVCDTAKYDETILTPKENSDEEKNMKQEAFGCLVVIASKYYPLLEPYMETILSLTTEALKGGVKSGALQCIEFWITICEKVIELQKQNKLDVHAISTVDCSFIEKPLSSFVPVLLNTLLKQEGDDDTRSIFMSAIKCLDLVARTIGDAIVPLAMQFVEINIKAPDWQSRKAATCALAVILKGPSIEKLAPVVRLLLPMIEDRNMEVRATAVWTLRRLFELLHSPACANRIFTKADLSCIVAVLGRRSKDIPEVSQEACRAIYFLAKGFELGHSSELSPFISDVFEILCSTSALAKETPLRLPISASAYEALCEVVRVSNIQDYKASAAIGVLMPRIMRRLNMVLAAKASSSGDKRNKYDHLVLLCGVLHVIIQKLGNTFAEWRTPYVLLLFCRVLTFDSCAARDKAALAIGALAHAVGPKFVDHMPILLQYFNGSSSSQFIYRGFSKPTLKPAILECFGEIALAIGKNFEKYLQAVMRRLKDAADPEYYGDVLVEDEVDYSHQLIQGILKAYSGILRGIKDTKSGLKVAADLVDFTEAVCKDESRDSSVTNTTVDVLGDYHSMVESRTNELIQELTKR